MRADRLRRSARVSRARVRAYYYKMSLNHSTGTYKNFRAKGAYTHFCAKGAYQNFCAEGAYKHFHAKGACKNSRAEGAKIRRRLFRNRDCENLVSVPIFTWN